MHAYLSARLTVIQQEAFPLTDAQYRRLGRESYHGLWLLLSAQIEILVSHHSFVSWIANAERWNVSVF
jgi:hypothetical protein